jgi:hypothetical protein
MTDDELTELRAAAEAATPGPWDVRICFDPERGVQDPYTYDAPDYCENLGVYSALAGEKVAGCGEYKIADAPDLAYIAAANPAAILRLLAHVDELTRQRDEARRHVEDNMLVIDRLILLASNPPASAAKR